MPGDMDILISILIYSNFNVGSSCEPNISLKYFWFAIKIEIGIRIDRNENQNGI